MFELNLRPGPQLLFRPRRYEQSEDGDLPSEHDVTHCAHKFLFDLPLHIEGGTTLADMLRLFESCQELKPLFANFYIDELRAEARWAPPPETSPDQRHLDRLELRPEWTLEDIKPAVLCGTSDLRLLGIGPPYSKDGNAEPSVHGQRTTYDISLSPLGDLLNLPIHINHTIGRLSSLSAMRPDMTSLTEALEHARLDKATLGQVLWGVVSELTAWGSPDERRQRVNELITQGSGENS